MLSPSSRLIRIAYFIISLIATRIVDAYVQFGDSPTGSIPVTSGALNILAILYVPSTGITAVGFDSSDGSYVKFCKSVCTAPSSSGGSVTRIDLSGDGNYIVVGATDTYVYTYTTLGIFVGIFTGVSSGYGTYGLAVVKTGIYTNLIITGDMAGNQRIFGLGTDGKNSIGPKGTTLYSNGGGGTKQIAVSRDGSTVYCAGYTSSYAGRLQVYRITGASLATATLTFSKSIAAGVCKIIYALMLFPVLKCLVFNNYISKLLYLSYV
jgi:hypothetical protein